MRLRVWCGIVVLVASLGCRSAWEPRSPSVAGAPVPEDPSSQSSTFDISDQALVQIFVFGLGVLEIQRPDLPDCEVVAGQRFCSLDSLDLYFPAEDGHTKLLSQGVLVDRVREWEELADLAGKTVRFDLAGDLVETRGAGPLGDFPEPGEELDARWMFSATAADSSVGEDFRREEASTEVNFGAGALQTCGLVHDNDLRICNVRLGETQRAASEYLVLRMKVDRGRPSVAVDLGGGASKEVLPMDLPFCRLNQPGGCAQFQGELFDRVFDIAITNTVPRLPSPGPRPLISNHAENHLRPLFPAAIRNWRIQAIDCHDFEGLSCLTYLFQYRDTLGLMDGRNQPVCPLVGYP